MSIGLQALPTLLAHPFLYTLSGWAAASCPSLVRATCDKFMKNHFWQNGSFSVGLIPNDLCFGCLELMNRSMWILEELAKVKLFCFLGRIWFLLTTHTFLIKLHCMLFCFIQLEPRVHVFNFHNILVKNVRVHLTNALKIYNFWVQHFFLSRFPTMLKESRGDGSKFLGD